MGNYISASDYPNADINVFGRFKNFGYGTLERIVAPGIVTGATSLLSADITSSDTTLTVVDESRFPATPFTVQVNAERMRVTSKAAAVFTVTRGYDNTEAVAHSRTQTVFEVLTEYIYLLNDGPIKSVDDVYIDGIKQLTTDYTAYTGQSGDEHTDWPGIAVIAFSADSYIGRQYNVEEGDISSEDIIAGRIEYASDPELTNDDEDAITLDSTVNTWGITIGLNGAGIKTQAFVKFKVDYSTINTQNYFIEVENASDDLEPIQAYVMVTEGDNLILSQPFIIPSESGNMILEVYQEGGIFDDVLRIYSYSSDLIVKTMRKDVRVQPQAFQEDPNLNESQEVAVLEQVLIDSQIRFATYSNTTLGLEIVKQTHIVEFEDNSGDDDIIKLALQAVEKNGTLIKAREFTLSGSSTFSLSLTHAGGSYDTSTRVIINDLPASKIEKMKIKKIIEYTSSTALAASSLAATSSGRIVIGDEVSADAKFAVDTTGDYGGFGNLIERPDWIIKHFLINRKLAAAADIDATSFAAAGALYDSAISGGYSLGFLLTANINEDQMAFESRSVIYMTTGKYYLDFIPDTAPAAEKTIPQGDIIGPAGFMFDHGRFEDLHTSYSARFGLKSDNSWHGVITAVDAGNKYGTRFKEVDLPLITNEVMAQDVLDNILLQHQALYKTINFITSWKYQGLQVGDTFDISSNLYDGTKFFVEKLLINSDNTITITAKQWW